MWSKACVRCGGDIYKEEELGDCDLVCLQCGFRKSIEPVPGYLESTNSAGRARMRERRVKLPRYESIAV